MYCTLITSARYVGLAGSGLGGGSKPTPPDQNFQSPVWGSSSTSGGLNPPQIERCLSCAVVQRQQ